jgi:hypothetical protein
MSRHVVQCSAPQIQPQIHKTRPSFTAWSAIGWDQSSSGCAEHDLRANAFRVCWPRDAKGTPRDAKGNPAAATTAARGQQKKKHMNKRKENRSI